MLFRALYGILVHCKVSAQYFVQWVSFLYLDSLVSLVPATGGVRASSGHLVFVHFYLIA